MHQGPPGRLASSQNITTTSTFSSIGAPQRIRPKFLATPPGCPGAGTHGAETGLCRDTHAAPRPAAGYILARKGRA
eukprot:7179459-Prymnesium_polylepis.1